MQGAISSLKGIRDWFYNQQAPFWTLSYYSSASPTGMGHVISRNTRFGDMEQSWEMLQQSIEAQTGSGRAQLNLIIYEKAAGANTPTGRTNIDIISSQVPGMPQVAGIGNLPAGYVDEARVNAIISEKQQLWELQRENQDLRNELDNPNSFADKAMAFVERIGSTPLGIALAQKYLGGQMPPMVAPAVNGMPPMPPTNEFPDEDVEPELDTLEAIAQQHGMTLKQFLAKTATLATQQPGVVQMLSQQ